jgi:hypothetical protein
VLDVASLCTLVLCSILAYIGLTPQYFVWNGYLESFNVTLRVKGVLVMRPPPDPSLHPRKLLRIRRPENVT